MAMASGLFAQTILAGLSAVAMTGTPATVNMTLSANIIIALMNNTETPDFDDTTPSWASTNEVVGTGWTTPGKLLNVAAAGPGDCAPAFSLVAGPPVLLKYDMTDVSVASTTLTNARGCILYFPDITAPAGYVDAQFLAVTFGSDYSTNNGTFGIQWNASGVFTIQVHA